jgi:L-seryl-tRNA(Ser) seleniumtransferase
VALGFKCRRASEELLDGTAVRYDDRVSGGDSDGAALRQDALRRLPAVGTLLDSAEVAPLVARFGRTLVLEASRAAIERARRSILAGDDPAPVGAEDVEGAALLLSKRALTRVINATGVVLHTNLGRSPLAEPALHAVAEVARGYSNLELELDSGERGSRQTPIQRLASELLGAEGALAVNNCAGAMLLMLAALGRGREVVVSRGELVEIGGGFRVPDVMRESGATLVEVGTTNKVRAADYARAITERTAALLRVHRSNFALVGFVEEPTIEELAELAHRRGVHLWCDVGSGLLAEEADLGPEAARAARDEPRPKALLAAGADLVAFSGDKLLGGPQAGLLAGRRDLIDLLGRHPLFRALRPDKLTLAALEATLRLYRDGRAAELPIVRALAESPPALEARAAELVRAIEARASGLPVEQKAAEALVGGGALPLARLSTWIVLVGPPGDAARALALALRRGDPPVVSRTVEDRVALDVRTLFATEIDELGRLVAVARTRVHSNQARE